MKQKCSREHLICYQRWIIQKDLSGLDFLLWGFLTGEYSQKPQEVIKMLNIASSLMKNTCQEQKKNSEQLEFSSCFKMFYLYPGVWGKGCLSFSHDKNHVSIALAAKYIF